VRVQLSFVSVKHKKIIIRFNQWYRFVQIENENKNICIFLHTQSYPYLCFKKDHIPISFPFPSSATHVYFYTQSMVGDIMTILNDILSCTVNIEAFSFILVPCLIGKHNRRTQSEKKVGLIMFSIFTKSKMKTKNERKTINFRTRQKI